MLCGARHFVGAVYKGCDALRRTAFCGSGLQGMRSFAARGILWERSTGDAMLCGARHFVGAVSDRDAPEVEFRSQALNFKVADRSYKGCDPLRRTAFCGSGL